MCGSDPILTEQRRDRGQSAACEDVASKVAIGAGVVRCDPDLNVPIKEIPRLRYPSELTPERFEREFVCRSEPVIIEGLVDDWPALHQCSDRSWADGSRWETVLKNEMLDCGFDPVDNRMMHFGDEEGEPKVLFNPGRVRMPGWVFVEVGRLRQEISSLRGNCPDIDFRAHPDLKERLNREVTVQNMPFLAVDADSPLHHFAPIRCRIKDVVPLSLYLSHDTSALPVGMRADVAPQAAKIMPGWQNPIASRIWATNGGPWRMPYPPWSPDSVPEPEDDQKIYSCFHSDRMENLHTVISGRKEVVLLPPGKRDVLNATRFSEQRQWLLASVNSPSGETQYMGHSTFTSNQRECTSDQSAVHPFAPAERNRRVSKGLWPDAVDFPVRTGTLMSGDTLYLPAYHWHWVATSTPAALGLDDGPLAMSLNFWWWPIHNDAAMEAWSFRNEEDSWRNARAPPPEGTTPPDRRQHSISFRSLTLQQRQQKGMEWEPVAVVSTHRKTLVEKPTLLVQTSVKCESTQCHTANRSGERPSRELTSCGALPYMRTPTSCASTSDIGLTESSWCSRGRPFPPSGHRAVSIPLDKGQGEDLYYEIAD